MEIRHPEEQHPEEKAKRNEKAVEKEKPSIEENSDKLQDKPRSRTKEASEAIKPDDHSKARDAKTPENNSKLSVSDEGKRKEEPSREETEKQQKLPENEKRLKEAASNNRERIGKNINNGEREDGYVEEKNTESNRDNLTGKPVVEKRNEEMAPDYKNRYDRTPVNTGRWVNEDGSDGQRGESKFVPVDPDVQKTLQDNGVDGIEYKDCYPDLSPVSKFDAYLEPDDYLQSDRNQFQMCNDSLADAVVPDPDTGEIANPELAAQFTPEQLADIEAGDTPYGYTWHHDTEAGHMQLVPTDVHQACRHAGGRSVWGGGADYR